MQRNALDNRTELWGQLALNKGIGILVGEIYKSYEQTSNRNRSKTLSSRLSRYAFYTVEGERYLKLIQCLYLVWQIQLLHHLSDEATRSDSYRLYFLQPGPCFKLILALVQELNRLYDLRACPLNTYLMEAIFCGVQVLSLSLSASSPLDKPSNEDMNKLIRSFEKIRTGSMNEHIQDPSLFNDGKIFDLLTSASIKLLKIIGDVDERLEGPICPVKIDNLEGDILPYNVASIFLSEFNNWCLDINDQPGTLSLCFLQKMSAIHGISIIISCARTQYIYKYGERQNEPDAETDLAMAKFQSLVYELSASQNDAKLLQWVKYLLNETRYNVQQTPDTGYNFASLPSDDFYLEFLLAISNQRSSRRVSLQSASTRDSYSLSSFFEISHRGVSARNSIRSLGSSPRSTMLPARDYSYVTNNAIEEAERSETSHSSSSGGSERRRRSYTSGLKGFANKIFKPNMMKYAEIFHSLTEDGSSLFHGCALTPNGKHCLFWTNRKIGVFQISSIKLGKEKRETQKIEVQETLFDVGCDFNNESRRFRLANDCVAIVPSYTSKNYKVLVFEILGDKRSWSARFDKPVHCISLNTSGNLLAVLVHDGARRLALIYHRDENFNFVSSAGYQDIGPVQEGVQLSSGILTFSDAVNSANDLVYVERVKGKTRCQNDNIKVYRWGMPLSSHSRMGITPFATFPAPRGVSIYSDEGAFKPNRKSIARDAMDFRDITSLIYSPNKNLTCITYWTADRSTGFPVVAHEPSEQSIDLDRITSNEIQKAIFSTSGDKIILVDSRGYLYRVQTSIGRNNIGYSLCKSRTPIMPQIDDRIVKFDMKFIRDDSTVIAAWSEIKELTRHPYIKLITLNSIDFLSI